MDENTDNSMSCKCCLEDGHLKNMWKEYVKDGEKEIYGEMIIECFEIEWKRPVNYEEYICRTCVTRLRDAFEFKNQVLLIQNELQYKVLADQENMVVQYHSELNTRTISNEETSEEDVIIAYDDNGIEFEQDIPHKFLDLKEEVEYEEVEYLDINEVVNESEIYDDGDLEFDQHCDNGETTVMNGGAAAAAHSEDIIITNDVSETVVVDVKDDEDIDENLQDVSRNRKEGKRKWSEVEPNVERKWPKRDRRAEKLRGYKKYTVEDLRKSLETVKSGKWSVREVSAIYNVPRKTISAYMRKFKDVTDPQDFKKHLRDDKQQGLIEEIKQILIYTNATPYKTISNLFYCIYCNSVKNTKHFDDPDDLRIHIQTEHVKDRTTAVDRFMRPHWYNEILKLDIKDLKCTVCCTALPSWNDMFIHLEEHHKIELDEAYIKVVPYTLGQNMNCALCKQSFLSYLHVDSHMNAHYNNYMCDECGDTFVTDSRLKKHARTHVIQKHPCEDCEKVFSSAVHKKRHHDLVHKKNIKMKCLFCDLKFPGELQRHWHVLECHREKVKYYTCECGKTFDWKPYYYKHMRRKHQKKMVKCKYCDVVYNSVREIKKHEATHKEILKNECKICNKTYCTTTYLKQHYWTSHGKMVETKKKLSEEL